MTTKVLISSDVIETSVSNAVAHRITYHSYDLKGRPTTASGLVIAPARAGSDRKVMTWCHGTTGMGDAACPSAQPDPASELKTYFESGSQTQIDYGIPGLQGFIDDDYVVVATDYQGLGTEGVHQYTVNRTNGIDGIRIVHAARELEVGAGNRVGVVGWSQGGAAAAAAAELDAADYGDLTLVGSAPISPGVPIIALREGTGLSASLATSDIPPDGHLFMNLAALAVAFPDTLSLSDVFTPVGIEIFETNWNIQPVHHLTDILGRAYKHQGQVMQVDQSKFPQWMAAFTEASATREKPVCPIHVSIDSQGGGTVCPVSWQTGYADAMTKLGGVVTTQEYPNDDHFSLPQSCIADVREWLNGLFAAN